MSPKDEWKLTRNMLMSENSSLIYEKSDVLWVNSYISKQQQQQQ